MLPSAFETPALRARRFADTEARRRKGLDGLIAKVDVLALKRPTPKVGGLQPEHVEACVEVLGAPSKKRALQSALDAPGFQLPSEALLAASRALDGPYARPRRNLLLSRGTRDVSAAYPRRGRGAAALRVAASKE